MISSYLTRAKRPELVRSVRASAAAVLGRSRSLARLATRSLAFPRSLAFRMGGTALVALCATSLAWPGLAIGGDAPQAAQPEAQERAVIHFVDLGGIEDWRAESWDAILIHGRNGRWYRANLFGACPGVRFANSIGFVTDATGDLDRFSSILVEGERCWIKSLERVDPTRADATPAAGQPKDETAPTP